MKTYNISNLQKLVSYYDTSAYVRTDELKSFTKSVIEEGDIEEEVTDTILQEIDSLVLTNYLYIECENQGNFRRHIWHEKINVEIIEETDTFLILKEYKNYSASEVEAEFEGKAYITTPGFCSDPANRKIYEATIDELSEWGIDTNYDFVVIKEKAFANKIDENISNRIK